MPDILHRISVTAPPHAVYSALTTTDGLSRWWAMDTSGGESVGDVLAFRFDLGGIDMRVLELERDARVLWSVVDGPQEWLGTTVSWDLSTAGDDTVVLFAHRGWSQEVEFMHHCSTKWAAFLLSLKSLVETGKGEPEPQDRKIGNWG
jgi:uncharacterized protein YndB with AHSA1/START domain